MNLEHERRERTGVSTMIVGADSHGIVEVDLLTYLLRSAECLDETKDERTFRGWVVNRFAGEFLACILELAKIQEGRAAAGKPLSDHLVEAIAELRQAAVDMTGLLLGNDSPVDSPAFNARCALALRAAADLLESAREVAGIWTTEVGNESVWIDATNWTIGELADYVGDQPWLRHRELCVRRGCRTSRHC